MSSWICLEKYSVKNISTAAKFDLLGKIFCQKYFDCCQGPRPSATVSGDFLSVQLHGCSLETCTPASPPARLLHHQSRLKIVLFQPTRGRVYPLQKNSLLDPGKKHFILEASGYYEILSGNMWQKNSSAV